MTESASNPVSGMISGLLNKSGGAGKLLQSLTSALAGGAEKAGGGISEGFQAVVGKLQQGGLGDQLKSWIGKGENQQVSGEEVAHALPDDALRQVAEENGMSQQEAADQLAKVLPQAVDKLTPEGHM
jgi:uncharacterized protein YidB (DUF937 family)